MVRIAQSSIVTVPGQLLGFHFFLVSNSLVIRQKGESQNGCFKKTKHAKFSEKQTFFTPDTDMLFKYQVILVAKKRAIKLSPY